jgi:hypothetical protein
MSLQGFAASKGSLEGETAANYMLRGKALVPGVIYSDAYTIAVKNGFDGTVEEWLASLKGDPGKDGAPGPQGADGAKGDKGDPGPQIVSVSKITGGNRLTITDVNGTKTVDVMDGKDGEKGADGKDGAKGEQGIQGEKGEKGDKGDKGNTGATGATGKDGYTPVKYTDYFTDADKAEIKEELGAELITQNTGDSPEKVMSQAAVAAALKTITALPYGGSKEWLENNGDKAQLYQIGGYVWGYVESNGWTKSDTQFLVVSGVGSMTNQGGTPYLLRSGNEGTVYAYNEASGDAGVPVYDKLPETANEGDIVAVGGRKYKAAVSSKEVPDYTNLADPTSADWREGYRISGSAGAAAGYVSALSGYAATNIIGVSAGDTIRIYGMDLTSNSAKVCKCAAADDVTPASSGVFNMSSLSSSGSLISNTSEGAVFTSSSDAYWRFSGKLNGKSTDVIITVNEEIKNKTVTTVNWTDIGTYTPPVTAGWSATDETYAVIDSLSATTTSGASAVYSADGYLYSYVSGADWVQMSRYNAPTLAIDGELSDSSTNALQNKVAYAALIEVDAKVKNNASDIATINERITDMETGSNSTTIPSFWQDAVDACITKIKALQVGRNCVTFPFFSDNHTRGGKTQYMGMLIAHVMKECGIPYCFCGGDAITSAVASTADTDAEFRAQAKAFNTAMSYIPDGRFCMALGNHEGVLKQNSSIEGSTTVTYDRNQTYDIFIRETGTAQNKHFGGDGTYYYVDDIASKVRWIVLNTNGIGNSAIDSTQLAWFENTALKFSESGWAVVIISHIPITNHYEQSNISNNTAVISLVQGYMNGSDANKADIVGWYSGHIHRDRIYTGVSVNDTDDAVGEDMGFKQVTITSDHTTIAYPIGNSPTYHPVGNDDQSHAIDFVTINKATRTVNLTRLGIGEDRSYSY